MAAILAAGESSRFGGGKQLALLGGKPLICWALEAALASGLSGVLLVVGHHGDGVRAVLPDDSCLEVLENPDPQEGMGSSLALAARRARELDAAGLVMLLGDMPFVASQSIVQVVRAAQEAEAGIAAGAVEGKTSHPVAFTRRHFDELAGLGGDKGARDILDRLGAGVALVEVAPESRLDVDTPGDLRRALAIYKAEGGCD